MSNSNNERRLISLGSFLGREIRSQLKVEDRPENEHIRWTDLNQLHLAWQGFFRTKEKVNFSDITNELEKIKAKFFPMLVNLDNTNIMPNKVTPTSLMWHAEILDIQGDRSNLKNKLVEFQTALSACLKQICVVPPSIQATPHVTLGRFPKNTKGHDVEHLEKMSVPMSKFVLEDFSIIEAIKEDNKLSFVPVEE